MLCNVMKYAEIYQPALVSPDWNSTASVKERGPLQKLNYKMSLTGDITPLGTNDDPSNTFIAWDHNEIILGNR
jgi:hypothetical protein